MCLTTAALGDFTTARKHWNLITPSFKDQYQKQKAIAGKPISEYLLSWVAVGEALQAGDHMALAKLLWENERTEANRFKLGRHWQPTAFPFQKSVVPITAASEPDQR